jgi:hypothetical protein
MVNNPTALQVQMANSMGFPSMKWKPCHSGKKSKECLTMSPYCSFDDSEKLKIQVIRKYSTPWCKKNFHCHCLYVSNKAWINNSMQKIGVSGRKILLLTDNCAADPHNC